MPNMWEKFDIRSTPFLEQFFANLDAVGMPGGGTVNPPAPPPTPPPAAEYTIIGKIIATEQNAGMSYVDGYCQMIDGDGDFVKSMSGETKLIHLRWRGNAVDAIAPVQVGPHAGYESWLAGYFSISPLTPMFGQWEIAAEDAFRGITSNWVPFNTSGTQVHAQFDWIPKQIIPPPPPTDPIEMIRNAAWQRRGIPYNPNAALALAARKWGLGIPMTEEFDIGSLRVQGFTGGILWCHIGAWNDIRQLPW